MSVVDDKTAKRARAAIYAVVDEDGIVGDAGGWSDETSDRILDRVLYTLKNSGYTVQRT